MNAEAAGPDMRFDPNGISIQRSPRFVTSSMANVVLKSLRRYKQKLFTLQLYGFAAAQMCFDDAQQGRKAM